MKPEFSEPVGSILTLLLCLLTSLSGCTVGPHFEEPDVSRVMQDTWQAADRSNDHFDAKVQPKLAWWRQFQDNELSDLIEMLFSSSLALAQARQRVIEESSRQGVVNADKWLQLSAALGYTRAETGDDAVSLQGYPPGKSVDVFSAGVVAGWELDIWGKTARLLEAAEESVRAEYADYQGMLVSLAAELTIAYIDVRAVESLLAKVRENIGLQEKTLTLVQSRLQAGNGTNLAVVNTERLLQTTRARIPELERRLTAAKNRINVLLGRPPSEEILHSGPLPAVPPLIGMGLPIDLLTRRPDIRREVHRYHGAVARIGAAEAERYPALSLLGTLTLSSDSLSGVFNKDSLIYLLGPEVRVPVLTGRRIESTVAVRTSQAEQARLALEQRILTALTEVENAAEGVVRSQEQVTELDGAEKVAIKSVELANSLYRAGLTDFFQVLDNQRQLLTIQESLLFARQQALSEIVHLYRALGGGWETAEISSSSPILQEEGQNTSKSQQ